MDRYLMVKSNRQPSTGESARGRHANRRNEAARSSVRRRAMQEIMCSKRLTDIMRH